MTKMQDVIEVAAFLCVELSNSLLLKSIDRIYSLSPPLSFSFWKHLETVITVKSSISQNSDDPRLTPAVLQVTRHPSIQLVIPKVLSFSWSSFIRLLRSIFLLTVHAHLGRSSRYGTVRFPRYQKIQNTKLRKMMIGPDRTTNPKTDGCKNANEEEN